MDQKILPKYSEVKVIVKGRVQGVGFRPFIFGIAKKYDIVGTVQNNMDGVRIFAEGKKENVEAFIQEIKENPPRLSRIDEVSVEPTERKGFSTFEIIESSREGKSSLVIPIDSATCPECLEEMRDPKNFRYKYPFINCTQCGPRYTIIEALPYDRPFTSMKSFQMCSKCDQEYHDPTNRRHHAQPIACASCGPNVMISSIRGEVLETGNESICLTARLLCDGKIVAIKGLGGYHLACDAYNEEAVQTLRKRKNRPKRPLAVMAANMETVEKICVLSEKERDLLQSPEAPIVILKKRTNSLADSLAPGMNTIGVMLPYTPLHHLLFDENCPKVLVMTSANPSGLPLVYKNEEAKDYLKGIADYILDHNREILHPIDDSVVRFIQDKQTFHRRARGYVPDPITTIHPVHEVVALGSEQKNTFALGRNEQIFIGPHIGDMGHVEVVEHYQREFAHLMKWMGIKAKTIAVDMHPYYTTRELAAQMDAQIIPVQHHHAHLVSCMEDNQLNEPVLGIILDGTGYGEDGNIWGFEFLYGDARSYKRMTHLTYTHLPGNEKAIEEPWRNAVAMLIDYFGEQGKKWAKELFPEREYEISILEQMIKKGINSPLSGTCGRLFDAVSAILHVCETATYDGEAAILLSEQMDGTHREEPYPFQLHQGDIITIDFGEMLERIVMDTLKKIPAETIIRKFHETVVAACVATVTDIYEKNPALNRKVALSGGSFHNPFLAEEIERQLKNKGFVVYSHHRVPCNDGGLSLGQIIIAANKKEQLI